ncbi:MAG: D-hexose-6-phosphate mutarotase [Gammaproteobacteria bacterium]|nr:D-hexose-6-phosphate mutarotase [Gammaproteobacteria bacterium]
MDTVEHLNQQFSIGNELGIESSDAGLGFIMVSTPLCQAKISLYAGQVLSFHPSHAAQDLLFVSDSAFFQQGKAIKGGCPICWPWFGENKQNPSLPFHGFVRTQLWQIIETNKLANGDIQIVLAICSNQASKQLWPYDFELQQVITLGAKLNIKLISKNIGEQVFDITQAVHTYFNVGAIEQIRISGLQHKSYLDKVRQFEEFTQEEDDLRFTQEVDRIYQQVGPSICITDPALKTKIQIDSIASQTTVVWNPWQTISKNSADLKDDDYEKFVCVETANAADEVIQIEPGQEYVLEVQYSIESID